MLRVRAFKQIWRGQAVEIFIEEINDKNVYIAKPIEMVRLLEKDRFKQLEPTFEIWPESAQKLMDDLWDCGLRPSEGSGSAGAYKAVQNHLEDMRKIAFNRLKI